MKIRSRLAVSVAVPLIVAGCAGNPPVSQLRSDVHTATFLQWGAEPQHYKFGVVDGLSFWATGAANATGTITVPVAAGTAQAAKVVANIANNAAVAAKAVGPAVAKSQEEQVADIFRTILNGRPIVTEIARNVFPTVAQAWQVEFRPEQMRLIPASMTLQNDAGVFTPYEPNTDIVVVFAVTSIELRDQPSVGGFFSNLGTLGFNDKDIAPELYQKIWIYKRDPADKKLKNVWTSTCIAPNLMMPATQKFSKLKADPSSSKEMFDGAVKTATEYCRKTILNQSSS